MTLSLGVMEYYQKKKEDEPQEDVKALRTKKYLHRSRQAYWINTVQLAGVIFLQTRVAAGVECSDIFVLQMTIAVYLAIQFITLTNITALFYFLSKAGINYTSEKNGADLLAGSGKEKTLMAVTILALFAKVVLIFSGIPVVATTLQGCREENNVDGQLRFIVSMLMMLIISEIVPWTNLNECIENKQVFKRKANNVDEEESGLDNFFNDRQEANIEMRL